ncbi:tetratricopeptide repeat protein 39b-like protein [Dermatophagoides farinae]|uniref:Tetratricopeptide repeat protein 39b-like protein n=1 Tax=Dermatophagoides farinae TaxID=6954 RepID=A0A9D4NV82_DERFA|nr:tetratricopeptide repeat protein 39B-like isoform X2 [Dermatophagoides farinae]KAH7638360.1 tetratricopeptide repeat protein 39b-like protein [Dermatophagoides farinae]
MASISTPPTSTTTTTTIALDNVVSEEEFEDAIDENISNSDDSGHSSQMTCSPDNSVSSHSSDDDLTANAEIIDQFRPSLEESLADIDRLLHMALDNRFHEAYEGTEKWSHCSLYHALGQGTLSFLKGCLTLERPEIQTALDNLRNCMDVCQREKRYSMTKLVWRPNYNSYTDVQIHAELCYAEALLMTALMTFLEDQNLLNLVRGAFRIRACYQSYKECFYILNNRTEWSSEYSRLHFESGVRLGIGTFNLMISHMPSKVLKLLEFVGFSGDRQQGLRELKASTLLQNGLRRPLAVLIMLAYQCYVEHIFGLGDGDMQCVDTCLDYGLSEHPDGAFFLLFLGRKKQLTGQINEAIEALKRCISVQNEWKQFHNICHWELLWCYAVQCDWINASKCADILRKQCKWSPAAYTYQYATFLYMIMVEHNRPELQAEISQLLRQVPDLRVRFAGKTVPAEKFAIVQSQRYFNHNNQLVLPAIEYMYIWNIFAVIGQSPHLLNPILERVQKYEQIEQTKLTQPDQPLDDYCRCLLLKGMCLRHLQQHSRSNECFLKVIDCKERIESSTYLIPKATLELGLNHLKFGSLAEARRWLDQAKTYSGYTLETIVHFRIHTAIRTINNQNKSQNLPENDHDDAASNKGGIRTIWSELSKRLTFSDQNVDDSFDAQTKF